MNLAGVLLSLAVACSCGAGGSVDSGEQTWQQWLNEDASAVTVVVVEYKPERGVYANARNYVEIINSVKLREKDLDLIVFPEATLVNGRPRIDDATYADLGDTPCTSNFRKYPKYMRLISCAALRSDSYVVINTIEKVRCARRENSSRRNCKFYGHYFYNTDIVFNNTGGIIQKYNKFNMFGEFDLDRPFQADLKTFTVKSKDLFGLFNNWDILFQQPAEWLVEAGVRNLIFPTIWFSELPFLTALQTQQMWAHEHDVTLFAAGANRPLNGSGGSGIYKGAQGPIVFNYDMQNATIMEYFTYDNTVPDYPADPHVITDVKDIDVLAIEMDNFYFMSDNLTLYNSVLLEEVLHDDGSIALELCHENALCCQFDVKVSRTMFEMPTNAYSYRLMVYSGVRSFDGLYNTGIEVCAVVACLDQDIRSCGTRYGNQATVRWPIAFERITITGDFSDQDATQYPNSLLSSIRPIHPKYTTWSDKIMRTVRGRKVVERKFSLNERQSRLMTFGIYGRKFKMDFDPKLGSGGRPLAAINILIINFVILINLSNVFIINW